MQKIEFMEKPNKQDKEMWALWKKYRLQKSIEFHRNLIDDLGIDDRDFNMKKVFTLSKGREIVYIFPSEFKREKGFFFELIDSDLMPADPERKVYRLAPSTSYHDEYPFDEGKEQYEVPIEELRVVNKSAVAISKSSAVTSSDNILKEKLDKPVTSSKNTLPLDDMLMSDITVTDYITIHRGIPVSAKPWLNDLVKFF